MSSFDLPLQITQITWYTSSCICCKGQNWRSHQLLPPHTSWSPVTNKSWTPEMPLGCNVTSPAEQQHETKAMVPLCVQSRCRPCPGVIRRNSWKTIWISIFMSYDLMSYVFPSCVWLSSNEIEYQPNRPETQLPSHGNKEFHDSPSLQKAADQSYGQYLQI